MRWYRFLGLPTGVIGDGAISVFNVRLIIPVRMIAMDSAGRYLKFRHKGAYARVLSGTDTGAARLRGSIRFDRLNVLMLAHGDYAWLGAESDSVADWMYMLNTEDWREAINLRFVNELLDATLPEEILKSYLIQDFKFYNNGMMARLIKLAPRQETKDMLAAQSQWFADNEATYFQHFLEAYHVSQQEYDDTEQTQANRDYGAYLDTLSDKSWPELITAICCMEWLYLAWAKRTVDAGVVQQVPAHKGWVDLHEGAHFRKWVGDLIALVNEYCSIDGPEAEVFRTIVHLERRFFDDSYPQD